MAYSQKGTAYVVTNYQLGTSDWKRMEDLLKAIEDGRVAVKSISHLRNLIKYNLKCIHSNDEKDLAATVLMYRKPFAVITKALLQAKFMTQPINNN